MDRWHEQQQIQQPSRPGAPAGTPVRGEGSSRCWAPPRLRALQAQRLTHRAAVAQVLGNGERRVVTGEQQNKSLVCAPQKTNKGQLEATKTTW